MNNPISEKERLGYTTPELEITHLEDADIITTSGIFDGFWGEEMDFRKTYIEYEW